MCVVSTDKIICYITYYSLSSELSVTRFFPIWSHSNFYLTSQFMYYYMFKQHLYLQTRRQCFFVLLR
nr:MAG TPA: hypothetical protein [Caudoviricetes sp.]